MPQSAFVQVFKEFLDTVKEWDRHWAEKLALDRALSRGSVLTRKMAKAAGKKGFSKSLGFKVKVTGGQVAVYDFKKKMQVYNEDYFEEFFPNYYKAAVKFTVETGADMTLVLAACLQDPIKKNNEKRYHMYRQLAKAAGYKERKALPEYMELAVKELYPEAKQVNYRGYLPA